MASRKLQAPIAVASVLSGIYGFVPVSDELGVSPALVKLELGRNHDIYYLYNASARASWRDVPKWFVGPWNYPLSGLVLFVKYRKLHPGLFASGAFALANVPIPQYFGGMHYHYWPAAFMALTGTAFVGSVRSWGFEVWDGRKLPYSVESEPRSSAIGALADA